MISLEFNVFDEIQCLSQVFLQIHFKIIFKNILKNFNSFEFKNNLIVILKVDFQIDFQNRENRLK